MAPAPESATPPAAARPVNKRPALTCATMPVDAKSALISSTCASSPSTTFLRSPAAAAIPSDHASRPRPPRDFGPLSCRSRRSYQEQSSVHLRTRSKAARTGDELAPNGS